MTEKPSIVRADGVTPAERYLKRLCDRTFLSLWSYTGVYRDQGRSEGHGDGHEVCDLLVVFEDHIIIFSDKDCAFPETGDLDQDWRRWYRRAIESSAKQVWGAERWVKSHPDRLFLDRACTQPFPLDVPDPATATFHRIVVAHGACERCGREFGGGGCLHIDPKIVGAMHTASRADGGSPLTIGQIDPAKGYVHVLDDTSLARVMAELDTITDFVTYLSKKERLILNGGLAWAAGEDDLLAQYLYPLEGKDENGFLTPPGAESLSIPQGLWNEFDRDEFRQARKLADRVSYFWDGLIESSSEHIIANTEDFATNPGIRGGAAALRVAARETRTQRRRLSTAFRDLIKDAPVRPGFRVCRIYRRLEDHAPYYAFLLMSPRPGWSESTYRENRRNFLMALCDVVKLKFPNAQDIVGIATELGDDAGRSQDVVYRDARFFSGEDRINAQRNADALGLLNNKTVSYSYGTEYDYPDPNNPYSRMPYTATVPRMKGRDRNAPCPCGSGRKYKRCCGLQLQ